MNDKISKITHGNRKQSQSNNNGRGGRSRKEYANKKVYLSEHNEVFFNKLKEKIIPGNNIIFLGAGLSSKTANKFKNFFKKKC